MMTLRIALVGVLLGFAAACGAAPDAGDTGGDNGQGAEPAAMPTAVPGAEGAVRTRNLVTVMDTGSPELCLGAVAESYPPQCGGPPITNWDWKTHGRDMFDKVGAVRWGQYALTGTFDGTSFTVTDAVPAALYDPMVPPPEPSETAGPGGFDEEDLNAALRDLPGLLSSYASNGRMLVDVMYDDGTLQAWADSEFGEGVVRISAALVPAS